MNINIINRDEAPVVPFPLDGRILYSTGRFELIHLILMPGQTVEQHTQPFDVLFYVESGSGTLVAGGQTYTPGLCSLTEVKGGTPRGWSNNGTEPLRLLVLKLVN